MAVAAASQGRDVVGDVEVHSVELLFLYHTPDYRVLEHPLPGTAGPVLITPQV